MYLSLMFRAALAVSVLAFAPLAQAQLEIGQVGEPTEISRTDITNLRKCASGSLVFDGECRDRSFFEGLLPDDTSLIDAEGCNPPLAMRNPHPDCGHSVDLIEKYEGSTGEEIRYVTIIAVKPPRPIASTGPIRGVMVESSQPKGIGYTRPTRAFDIMVRGKKVLEGETQADEFSAIDLDMAPFRGPYQVMSYKADEIEPVSGGYRHISDFRVFGADRHVLSNSVQDLTFLNAGLEEYDVSGRVCSNDPDNFLSHLESGFADKPPAPFDCTCMTTRCFDPVREGRARSLPKGEGTSVQCEGDNCNVCSIIHTDDVIETELRYSRIVDRIGRKLPSGQYRFDRVPTDCFEVSGRHLNSYYRSMGSTPDGPTCDTSVFLHSNSTLCWAGAGVVAGLLASGELLTQMGFKPNGGISGSLGTDSSVKVNLAVQFSSLNNLDYSIQNTWNTIVENATSWNDFTQMNMCSADSSLNLELADSVCQSVQGNASCNGSHTARISFMEDGKSYSAMAELECHSSSGNSQTKLGDSDCQCEVKWFIPG